MADYWHQVLAKKQAWVGTVCNLITNDESQEINETCELDVPMEADNATCSAFLDGSKHHIDLSILYKEHACSYAEFLSKDRSKGDSMLQTMKGWFLQQMLLNSEEKFQRTLVLVAEHSGDEKECSLVYLKEKHFGIVHFTRVQMFHERESKGVIEWKADHWLLDYRDMTFDRLVSMTSWYGNSHTYVAHIRDGNLLGQAYAFAMGRHSRLGKDSFVSDLDDLVMHRIDQEHMRLEENELRMIYNRCRESACATAAMQQHLCARCGKCLLFGGRYGGDW